jgi:HNH endonuclease
MTEEYTCDRCGYQSDDITNFRRHLTRKSVCEVKFQDIDINVLRNEYLAPPKDKTLSCDTCNKQFASRSGLHVHKKKCDATPEIQPIIEEIEELQVPPQQYQAVYSELPATILIDIQSLKEQLRQEFMTEKNNQMLEILTRLSKLEKNQLATTSNNAPKTVPQKHKIPHSIRCKAWDTHIGAEIGKAKCFCCNKNAIWQYKFTCGHIISRAHGGTLAMDNLRPICDTCNNDMGNENMREFAQRIYNVEIV